MRLSFTNAELVYFSRVKSAARDLLYWPKLPHVKNWPSKDTAKGGSCLSANVVPQSPALHKTTSNLGLERVGNNYMSLEYVLNESHRQTVSMTEIGRNLARLSNNLISRRISHQFRQKKWHTLFQQSILDILTKYCNMIRSLLLLLDGRLPPWSIVNNRQWDHVDFSIWHFFGSESQYWYWYQQWYCLRCLSVFRLTAFCLV